MTHKVLIDYNALGWADQEAEKIKKDYEEILRVGEVPNLPMKAKDNEIASYCEEQNCDLLTTDKRAYTEMLTNHRVKAVQISRYDWDDSGNKQVYLIQIL